MPSHPRRLPLSTAMPVRLSLLVLALLPAAAAAQTSFPMITHTFPLAVQRGKTAEVTVEGQQNFAGAYKVLVGGEGVKGEVVQPVALDAKAKPGPPPQLRSVKVRFTVAENALPGPREFRLATPLGISSIGQLVVADAPVVLETPDNNTPAKASPL